nr:MAG TPA: Helix-turn-helix XRE-family like protein [Caudoviricetes sp.]
MQFDISKILQRIEIKLAEIGMPKQEFYARSGISSASFSQWNTGAHKPTIKKLKDAADVLGTSVEYLLYGEESPAQDTKKERPADGEALNVDEWIKKARTMSNGDLNLALRELLKIQAERIAEDERTEH